ncbi:translocated actin-recruiting phosphoprotein isoform X2 [Carassius gibelio]|uniref:translocated actin-recruiting phosphoprotein isoform X2 n=1 Tax=Carassius gibelio TaxID=101364 RepID=UPI002277C8E7|nr:translocated actin-recruiting phosphoprotein isoform X2 [Carassius gibelio]
MRMAVRRMNELWKTMGLALMFGFLLLHSCQGQSPTVTSPDSSSSTAAFPAATSRASSTATTEETPTESQQASSTVTQTATRTAPPTTEDITVKATNSNSGPNDQKTTIPSQTGSVNQTPQLHTTASQSTPVTNQTEKPNQLTSDLMESEIKEEKRSSPRSPSGSSSGSSHGDSGSSSAVFVSLLVIGLLLAAIIIGIYYFKCHRRNNARGMKLAEESYMADEENQGNTLVSVDPLNQPEPQEKPSLNGESQEAVKAQTPPAATNGHSTTKTADTEL